MIVEVVSEKKVKEGNKRKSVEILVMANNQNSYNYRENVRFSRRIQRI